MTGLGNRLASQILMEFAPGYIFAPFGAYGRAFIIARTSSRAVVRGVEFFCFSALPLIAVIVAAGIHSRIVHSPLTFLFALPLAAVWCVAYLIWAKVVTRGMIEYPRNSAGADDAR